ncbi:MAG TPA: hypothetical protein VK890_03430, partial [Bacteroidia bacterium]|nr:hypothetical protein [Bacteroidia bacterium]
ATSAVDLEMVKRVAIYLLGDQSGLGVKLRKTHNADFINFLIKRDDDPYNTYKEYRELLKKNFESKFHVLNI